MTTRPRLLLVDDEAANLNLLRQILKADYDLTFAKSGAATLAALEKARPDLVLLDVMMPDMDGFEVVRRMQSDPRYSAIPVIFCTAMSEENSEVRAFEVGGVDFVTKPVRQPIVLARVRMHLALQDQRRSIEAEVEKAHGALIRSRTQAFEMLGRAAEYKDNETGNHIRRMSEVAAVIARAHGWPEDEVMLLKNAAPMHDIGKLGVPEAILQKPGKLTPEEYEIVKTHCEIGARIIADYDDSRLFQLARTIALTHHEKWDGSGYPNGLAGEEIPLHGRVVAIADVFDALTSNRPYKEAWSLQQAADLIQREAGAHFDPTLAALFVSVLDEITDVMTTFGNG